MAKKNQAQSKKGVKTSREVPAPLPRKRRSCIVLGAGLAGLAAAHRLTEKGWDVRVVEAQDRIGGRVFSHQFDEDPSLVCELGGEWIGKDHDEMLRLSEFFGLDTMRHRYAYSFWEDGKPLRFTAPGKWPLSGPSEQRFKRLEKEYNAYNLHQRIEMDKLDWATKLDQAGFELKDLLRRDLMDSTDFGESVRQVSAYVGATEYFGAHGVGANKTDEMDYKLGGGNSTLVYALADSVGRTRIHTNFVVRKIHQDGNGVEVVSAKGERLSAEFCICTLPAHQLPKIDWGKADLPQDQRDAARQLQYARITKTAVLCSKRFWPTPPRGGFSVFTTLASDFCFDSTLGQGKDGDRGILCSYAIGDKADDIAAAPLRKLKDWIAGDVANAAGLNWKPKQVRRVALTAKRQPWQNDDFTRGAYAFYRPGQWFTIRDILKQAHRKVSFAGEHIAEEQGFMEGAVVTGRDAADKL
jgi:monoamine oxidase